MSSPKPLRWRHEERHRLYDAARCLAAFALRRASALLARLAVSLSPPAERADADEPRVEFHAEAGAPEGALYVDGRFVGWLPGVSRL